jgi:hypothetical protein
MQVQGLLGREGHGVGQDLADGKSGLQPLTDFQI